MPKLPLTDRQKQLYQFVEDYQFETGKSPKILEIQQAFQIKSVNGVIKHLRALEKKGWIERDNTPRGIKLLEKAQNKLDISLFNIPIFGTIPAGNPVEMTEFAEGYIPLEHNFVPKPSRSFALRVRGESMIDAGIFEGDIVIIEQKEPRKGDIVAALVDGESTLKRYLKNENDIPYLKAENSKYPDIHAVNSLEVQGVVVYLMRQY